MEKLAVNYSVEFSFKEPEKIAGYINLEGVRW
jgi:hypothetical protein